MAPPKDSLAPIGGEGWGERAIGEIHLALRRTRRLTRSKVDRPVLAQKKPFSSKNRWIACAKVCRNLVATAITFVRGRRCATSRQAAAHESPRTTKLSDRMTERLMQDEVERIRL